MSWLYPIIQPYLTDEFQARIKFIGSDLERLESLISPPDLLPSYLRSEKSSLSSSLSFSSVFSSIPGLSSSPSSTPSTVDAKAKTLTSKTATKKNRIKEPKEYNWVKEQISLEQPVPLKKNFSGLIVDSYFVEII